MTVRFLPLLVSLLGCAAPKPTTVAALVVVDGTVTKPGAEVATCLDPSPIHKAVSADGGFRWNLHRFASDAETPSTIQSRLTQMKENYLAANFNACHAGNLIADLSPERLLAADRPREAVEVALFGAACAWKLGNEFVSFAETQLRFVLAKDELDAMGVLSTSKILRDPEFHTFVGELHKRIPQKRLWTAVSVTPEGASISINGRANACARGPCRFQATEGDTVVIAAERFGYARYTGTLEAGKTGTFAMYSVDRDTEHQVASAIQRREKSPYTAACASSLPVAATPKLGGLAPSLDAIGEAASRSLAAKVVLLVDVRAKDASAMVYDQRLHRVVARRTQTASASQRGSEIAPSVSLEALRGWREKTATRWYKSWKFWAGVAVVGALASGGAVYYFKENEYVLRPVPD